MTSEDAQVDAGRAAAAVETAVALVVDAANVVGARPDGWWRDRAGAATRLVERLGNLPGRLVHGPSGAGLRVATVHVVLEGQARGARVRAAEGLVVVLAPRDGDSALAHLCERLDEQESAVVVVTADRGLRARLPARADVAGPGWLHALLDDHG